VTQTPLHYASFIAESGSALGGNAGALVVTSTNSTTASVVPPATARLPLATIGALTVTASVSGPTVSGNQIIIATTGRYSISGFSQQRGNNGATSNNNEVVQITVNGAIVATSAARDIDAAVVGKTLPFDWAGNLTAGDAVDVRIRRGGATDVDINRYAIIVQQEPTSVVVAANVLPAYPVTTKTANYTTLASDFGGYLRFTAGVPTLHAPAAGNIGQQIVIRNATASQFTCVAGAGATIAGSLVVAPAECIAFIATGAGTYDAVGGI
jgi:hypothetical protein